MKHAVLLHSITGDQITDGHALRNADDMARSMHAGL